MLPSDRWAPHQPLWQLWSRIVRREGPSIPPMQLTIGTYPQRRQDSHCSVLADTRLLRMAGQVWDPALMAFRPQRFSLASSKSSMTWDELESAPATQRSSISSYASLGSEPSNYSFAHTTATSLGSRRSSFTGQARSRSRGPRPPTFTNLPPEIYECIIQQLRYSHFEPSSQSCATCYARDLYSLALTSRGWDRAVRIQLYVYIWHSCLNALVNPMFSTIGMTRSISLDMIRLFT